MNPTLRVIKLNYTTLHPNNFEKHEVHLVVNIFNDKTCVALDGKPGMENTEKFVKYANPNVEHFKHQVL